MGSTSQIPAAPRRKTGKIQRVMPILGTFIILLTYIGKEHLKEDWKDTAAQIDMAHYFYSVLVDTTAEESRFLSTHLQLVRIQKLILDHGTPMFKPADIVRYNIEALDIDSGQIGAALETLKVIVEKLPEKDENKKTLNDLITESDRLRKAETEAVDISPPENLPYDHDKFWQAAIAAMLNSNAYSFVQKEADDVIRASKA